MVRATGFWFVDIPRSSSSAIRAQLGAQFGRAHGKTNIPETDFATPQIFPDHLSAREMRDRLGPDVWDELVTFSVVRNPWARIVSYYFFRRSAAAAIRLPEHWSLADYVASIATARAGGPVDPMVAYAPARMTCCEFLTDETGALLVDHVIRFEDRAAGLNRVGRLIGLDGLGQLALNASSPSGRHYLEFFDRPTRDLVAHIYAEDCDRFGYGVDTA